MTPAGLTKAPGRIALAWLEGLIWRLHPDTPVVVRRGKPS